MLTFLFGSCNAQKKKLKEPVEVDGSPNTTILPIDSSSFPTDRSQLKNYPFYAMLNLRGKVKSYNLKKHFAHLQNGIWKTTQQVSGESLSHEFSEDGVLIRTTEFDTYNGILGFRLYSYKDAPAVYTVNRYQYYDIKFRTTRFTLDRSGKTLETSDYYDPTGNYVYHKFEYADPDFFMIDNTVDEEDSILRYKQYRKDGRVTTITAYSKEKFAPQTTTLLTVEKEIYNERNDLIHYLQTDGNGKIIEQYAISYEYDQVGNWISCLQKSETDSWNYMSKREIVYW